MPVVRAFLMMQTQWRIGPAGPTGLDYGVLPAVLDLAGITGERAAVFAGVRVMEGAALDALATRR